MLRQLIKATTPYRKHNWCEMFYYDGVVFLDVEKGVHNPIKAWKLLEEISAELTGWRSAPVVLNISKIGFINKGARDYRGDRFPPIRASLIMNPLLSRVFGNFFVGINKPPFPVKLINNLEKARLWAKSRRD